MFNPRVCCETSPPLVRALDVLWCNLGAIVKGTHGANSNELNGRKAIVDPLQWDGLPWRPLYCDPLTSVLVRVPVQ